MDGSPGSRTFKHHVDYRPGWHCAGLRWGEELLCPAALPGLGVALTRAWLGQYGSAPSLCGLLHQRVARV